MKTVKTISLDYFAVDTLAQSLRIYWMVQANRGNITREELYRSYLIKKFYEKLGRRQVDMVESGRKVVKIKFDAVHAVLLVDVLQRVDRTTTGQMVLMELGPFCPSQMQSE